MTSNSESIAAQAPDIVALSSSVGLTPSEWLDLSKPAEIVPLTAEEFSEAALSTVLSGCR